MKTQLANKLFFLIIAILALASASAKPRYQNRKPFFPFDKKIFKGHIVGVFFYRNNVIDGQWYLRLEFIVERNFTDLKKLSNLDRIRSVRTDRIVEPDEFRIISESNYQNSIQGMMPDGIQIGRSCLVVTSSASNLISIQPTTPKNEKLFIAEHKQYILDSRFHVNHNRLNVRMSHIDNALKLNEIIRKTLSHPNHGLKEEDVEYRRNRLKESQQNITNWCMEVTQLITKRLQELREMKQSGDALDRETAELLIPDTEELQKQAKTLCKECDESKNTPSSQ